jgi:hypothetical protein
MASFMLSSPVRSPFFLPRGSRRYLTAPGAARQRHLDCIPGTMPVVAVMRIGDAGGGAALRGAR